MPVKIIKEKLCEKYGDVPPPRAGFDSLSMSAPLLVQMNPQGKWESCPPDTLDEARLREVVAHLMQSRTVDAAQSYCCQCAAESSKDGVANTNTNYVPIIMMPLYPSDACPFDMDAELEKMKKGESKPTKNVQKAGKNDEDKVVEKKKKKRGFVLQRLTDFDLLSQW